tara:strand:+ start:139805 stop:140137 length:333 start_codon:yes stop_codon:yes gene_type:complete
MGIKFDDLIDGLVNAPLTDKEVIAFKECERLIDFGILESFDVSEIHIPTHIIECTGGFVSSEINKTRRKKIAKEIKKYYKKLGWKFTFYMGEDDGPNRPGAEYYILTGRK